MDGVDLSSCDREPIHLIGSIQPHGALLAADERTLAIRHASANAADWLGHAPQRLLTMSLSDLLDPDELAGLRRRAVLPQRPDLLRPLRLALRSPGGGALECLPHSHDGRIVLEFVRAEERLAAAWEEDDLRQRIIAELVRPESLDELARLGADIVRRVNGFDRVMIYRFAEDQHGEVIAESTDRPDSFLGLHYPASDIPEPARRHFVLNVVRAITDIRAAPVPILSAPGETEPLDLTFSKLRAVAPVHVEYLGNMGVQASMSISLVTNDRLWGLIACQHYGPRELSLERLRFCELLGGTISALLQGIENRAQLRRSIEAERLAHDLEKAARNGPPLAEIIVDHADALRALTSAPGLVLRLGGADIAIGNVPSPQMDYAPLRDDMSEGVAVSDHLSAVIPMEEAQRDVAAGAAYLELSEGGDDFLVLLRQHHEHTIGWAGRPDKVEVRTEDGATRLSPRRSFDLWREERVGRSRPFDAADREALRILRRALFALNSIARERIAVRRREQAEAEEQRLRLALIDAARRTSMGELASALAHELKQPLAAVANYVNACRREMQNQNLPLPEVFDALMRDAVSEATRAADLVNRLRDFIAGGTLAPEWTDLHAPIRQAIDLAMLAHGVRPEVVLDIPEDLPPVWADPVQIGQVVLNLALNAIAAMRGCPERLLTVRARAEGDTVLVAVRDTGPGVAPEIRGTLFEPFHGSTTGGMGFGLSLCRSIVEAHGGRIWSGDPERGAEIAFSIPNAGPDDAQR